MSEDEIILPVQHMFPNCQKYKKCCREDKKFWDKVSESKEEIPEINKKPIMLKQEKMPEDFEGY